MERHRISTYLLQVELVGKHSLANIAFSRLPWLPISILGPSLTTGLTAVFGIGAFALIPWLGRIVMPVFTQQIISIRVFRQGRAIAFDCIAPISVEYSGGHRRRRRSDGYDGSGSSTNRRGRARSSSYSICGQVFVLPIIRIRNINQGCSRNDGILFWFWSFFRTFWDILGLFGTVWTGIMDEKFTIPTHLIQDSETESAWPWD